MASTSCMPPKRNNSSRVFSSWLCLFAAICLYAPLAAAAWPASTSCCDGNHCAIPAHQHRGASHRTSSEASHGMQCEYGGSGMANCSMACCQQQDRAPIPPAAYVMPPPVSIAAPVVAASAFVAQQPNEFLRSAE